MLAAKTDGPGFGVRIPHGREEPTSTYSFVSKCVPLIYNK